VDKANSLGSPISKAVHHRSDWLWLEPKYCLPGTILNIHFDLRINFFFVLTVVILLQLQAIRGQIFVVLSGLMIDYV